MLHTAQKINNTQDFRPTQFLINGIRTHHGTHIAIFYMGIYFRGDRLKQKTADQCQGGTAMSNITHELPGKNNLEQMMEEAKSKDVSTADEMKNIRKQRLQREVMVDPSKAKKLIKLEASPVYNAQGKVIQSTGSL
jgi:hypothetical protein